VVGLIYAIFAKAGFLLKLTLNGKSKVLMGLETWQITASDIFAWLKV
jgi:hypothetical protein